MEEDIIIRCYTILPTISSGDKINNDKFEDYNPETGKQLVYNYPWNYIPSTAHKLLIHSSDVIEKEAAKAKNNDTRRYRVQHTRNLNKYPFIRFL